MGILKLEVIGGEKLGQPGRTRGCELSYADRHCDLDGVAARCEVRRKA